MLGDQVPGVAHRPGTRPRVRPWLAAGMAAASIAGATTTPGTQAPEAGNAIRVDTVAVPLNPKDPSQTSIGDFRYAGGLALSSDQTTRLHGLSDVVVADRERLTAIGDEGVLFEARLILDEADRLVDLTDTRLTLLVGEDGRPLPDKAEADAEGLAQLPGGDRLVSFERHHRILRYPADGSAPRRVASPSSAAFPANGGMEAITADAEAGPDAYAVGLESTGQTWTCRLAGPCVPGPTFGDDAAFGLVAMRRLPGRQTAYLQRAYDEVRGSRIALTILRAATPVARMDLARPLTVDNFEGLAAATRPDGAIRFYLISDDNGSATQRTLLLAFDWPGR
jgi:hypothetical protein